MSASVVVDWAKVLNRCSPNVRKSIMDIRSRHEDLRRLIGEARASMPQIDLASYRTKLQGATEYASLLGECESKLQAFQPTKVDVQSQLSLLEEERKRKVQHAEAHLQQLEQNINSLRDQLTKLKNAKPVDEMTVDDVYALYPEMKEKVYDNIRNDRWATTEDASSEQEQAHHKH